MLAVNDLAHETRPSYRGPLFVLAALLALTAATVGVSRFDLGPLRIWIALAIAAAKASLVMLFFMKIRSAGTAVAGAVALALAILVIFIGFIFFDVAFR